MASLDDVLPFRLLLMRPIQTHLRFSSKGYTRRHVPMSPQVKQHPIWWTIPANLKQGVEFQQTRTVTSLVTDASLSRWGLSGDLKRCRAGSQRRNKPFTLTFY
ncbi:hypothetical protein HOLleu_05324 [Holothuria leucospilota]|uniref:Uncharacterized protein n=1 Tax=Holothuria leucospilota TaxID=206669 RepID=A0A9Q1CJW3_HOLLE|nr:hypothetical protein HOLleu_05324 [Holothuria leucospilota]